MSEEFGISSCDQVGQEIVESYGLASGIVLFVVWSVENRRALLLNLPDGLVDVSDPDPIVQAVPLRSDRCATR